MAARNPPQQESIHASQQPVPNCLRLTRRACSSSDWLLVGLHSLVVVVAIFVLQLRVAIPLDLLPSTHIIQYSIKIVLFYSYRTIVTHNQPTNQPTNQVSTSNRHPCILNLPKRCCTGIGTDTGTYFHSYAVLLFVVCLFVSVADRPIGSTTYYVLRTTYYALTTVLVSQHR